MNIQLLETTTTAPATIISTTTDDNNKKEEQKKGKSLFKRKKSNSILKQNQYCHQQKPVNRNQVKTENDLENNCVLR